jgi:hypothetical protein
MIRHNSTGKSRSMADARGGYSGPDRLPRLQPHYVNHVAELQLCLGAIASRHDLCSKHLRSLSISVVAIPILTSRRSVKARIDTSPNRVFTASRNYLVECPGSHPPFQLQSRKSPACLITSSIIPLPKTRITSLSKCASSSSQFPPAEPLSTATSAPSKMQPQT